MRWLSGRCVVVAMIVSAGIGVSACGSSSKSTAKAPAASTPATPSTPSTTTTTASGPLTKAAVVSILRSNASAGNAFKAAVQAGNLRAIAAGAPNVVASDQKIIAQLSALKAPSATAAAAQQKFISVAKQAVALVEQMGKAASANDAAAYTALGPKYKALHAQINAAAQQLNAALP